MTRSNAREIAVHLIYAARVSGEPVEQVLERRFDESYYAALAEDAPVYAERPGAKQRGYIEGAVRGVFEKLGELDGYIAELSVGWNLSRISKLARVILELAMYEALYVEDVPPNVAIHEAVLLAQKYEEAETVAFVNGILGAFSRKYVGAGEGAQ